MLMEIRAIALSRGWGLFGRGWNTFKADWVTWVLSFVIFFVITIVLNLVPLLGGLVMAVITPAFLAGFMKIAHDIEAGETVGVGHLFQPIQDHERRVPLLLLGLVALLAGVVMAVVLALFIGGAAQMGGAGGAVGAPMAFPLAGVGFFGFFVIVLLYLAVFAVLAFSIPLVYFRDVAIGDAITASVTGTLKNIGPLVIFSLIYFVLAFFAMLPFALGFLVLGPVALAAVYGAYREIFGGGIEVLEAELV
jgi:uncharacterized membrane protein